MSSRLTILDVDGTLLRGQTAIPGAAEAMQRFRSQGAVCFCTNNSSKRADQTADRLTRAGIEAAPEEVLTSAHATVHMLQGQVESAFVLGDPNLEAALLGAGIRITDEAPDAVVVGIDWQCTYEKLAAALRCLLREGTRFVATNRDATYPVEDGLLPGAGALVAALEVSSGRSPEVAGKPSPLLFQMAMERAGASPASTLAIGDRMETDYEAAMAAGCRGALVLTGVTGVAPPGVPCWPSIADVE